MQSENVPAETSKNKHSRARQDRQREETKKTATKKTCTAEQDKTGRQRPRNEFSQSKITAEQDNSRAKTSTAR